MVVPTPRANAAVTLTAAGKLWLLGGNDGTSSLGDVWYYSLQDGSWCLVRAPRLEWP